MEPLVNIKCEAIGIKQEPSAADFLKLEYFLRSPPVSLTCNIMEPHQIKSEHLDDSKAHSDIPVFNTVPRLEAPNPWKECSKPPLFKVNIEERNIFAENLNSDKAQTVQIKSEQIYLSEDHNVPPVYNTIPRIVDPRRESTEPFSEGSKEENRLKNSAKETHRCEFCRKTFSCRSLLERHQITHSREKVDICDVPSKSYLFSSASNIENKLLTHTKGGLCQVCNKKISKSNLKRHLFIHTGHKSFSCDICSKSFSEKNNLKTHLLTHTGEKSFLCDICTKSFSLRSHLKAHLLTHTGEKPFSCDICTKSFSLNGNLKAHLLTHAGQKAYSCDFCFKAFSQRSLLKSHQLVHTGVKTYSCDVCSKSFKGKASLKTHVMNHTGEKSFSCDVCSKSFSQSLYLNEHLLIHSKEKPFICEICSKGYSSRSSFRRHQLSHTGERNFSCDVCSKSFSLKTHLRTHVLTHTGEKSFSCDICTKRFALSGYLKKHLLTHMQRGTEDCQ